MHQYLDAGHFGTHLIYVPGPEAPVNRAMSFPKNQARTSQLAFRISAKLFCRVPQDHLVQWNPKLDARVAPQMLVWEEEKFIRLLQALVKERHGVRRSANDPSLLSAESFDRGGRVHVRNRH